MDEMVHKKTTILLASTKWSKFRDRYVELNKTIKVKTKKAEIRRYPLFIAETT